MSLVNLYELQVETALRNLIFALMITTVLAAVLFMVTFMQIVANNTVKDLDKNLSLVDAKKSNNVIWKNNLKLFCIISGWLVPAVTLWLVVVPFIVWRVLTKENKVIEKEELPAPPQEPKNILRHKSGISMITGKLTTVSQVSICAPKTRSGSIIVSQVYSDNLYKCESGITSLDINTMLQMSHYDLVHHIKDTKGFLSYGRIIIVQKTGVFVTREGLIVYDMQNNLDTDSVIFPFIGKVLGFPGIEIKYTAAGGTDPAGHRCINDLVHNEPMTEKMENVIKEAPVVIRPDRKYVLEGDIIVTAERFNSMEYLFRLKQNEEDLISGRVDLYPIVTKLGCPYHSGYATIPVCKDGKKSEVRLKVLKEL